MLISMPIYMSKMENLWIPGELPSLFAYFAAVLLNTFFTWLQTQKQEIHANDWNPDSSYHIL